MTHDKRIAYYRKHIYPRVEGWLHEDNCNVVGVIGCIQKCHGVHGSIVEVGVHHGKFLLLIDTLREGREKTYAVDLFDNQKLSPHEDHELEMRNASALKDTIALAPWGTDIEIMRADTLSLGPGFPGSDIKLFSIDAGHAPLNAFNDLVIAQEAMVPGGIVAFDDFFNPCWPGATEGLYRFMAVANRRLKPLLFCRGKLYLTTASEHQTLLPEYRDALIHVAPWAITKEICGHDCLVMSWDGY